MVGDELEAGHQRVSPAKYRAALRRMSRSSSNSRTRRRNAAFSCSTVPAGCDLPAAVGRPASPRRWSPARAQLRNVSRLTPESSAICAIVASGLDRYNATASVLNSAALVHHNVPGLLISQDLQDPRFKCPRSGRNSLGGEELLEEVAEHHERVVDRDVVVPGAGEQVDRAVSSPGFDGEFAIKPGAEQLLDTAVTPSVRWWAPSRGGCMAEPMFEAGAKQSGRVFGPPRWVLGTTVAVASLFTLAAAAWPGGSFVLFFLVPILWFVLGSLWLIRLVIAGATKGGLVAMRRRWKTWLVLPAAFIAAVAVASTDLPMRAGVRIAEPAMLAYSRDPHATAPSWVGFYPILYARRDGARVSFAVRDSGVKRTGGFIYSPPGSGAPCDFCEHVTGPWWQDVGQD